MGGASGGLPRARRPKSRRRRLGVGCRGRREKREPKSAFIAGRAKDDAWRRRCAAWGRLWVESGRITGTQRKRGRRVCEASNNNNSCYGGTTSRVPLRWPQRSTPLCCGLREAWSAALMGASGGRRKRRRSGRGEKPGVCCQRPIRLSRCLAPFLPRAPLLARVAGVDPRFTVLSLSSLSLAQSPALAEREAMTGAAWISLHRLSAPEQ